MEIMVYCGWDNKRQRNNSEERVEMFTIIIGEEGEYGRRLRNYLETHWEGSLRLHSYSKPETVRTSKEEADCWLLDEEFFRRLQEERQLSPDFMRRCILLSDEEKEGCFCRYHPPAVLMKMLREKQGTEAQSQTGFLSETTVTAVYSPIFDPELSMIITSRMKPGDLYLGMEDVGAAVPEKGDMGDLCYYIGLQSGEIMDRVKETAWENNGIWYVNSPELYFDLLELSPDEYQWFFQCLRDCGDYGNVYVGLGSGILAVLPLNGLFDRFILIDSSRNDRQHTSCGSLERVFLSEGRKFGGSFERIYREEVLYGADQ